MREDGLPKGWTNAKLGELVSPSKEKIEPAAQPHAPYLSLEHIESHTGRILGRGRGADVESTKAVFHSGDVLYGKLRPYLNKVCIPDFDGICSTDILVFPKSAPIQNGFLLRFLMQATVVDYANHNSNGIQLPRISFDKLADLPLALPPVAEQQRIVAKVEALLARVNAARQRLAKVPAILKRFRQSVLAAAFAEHPTIPFGNVITELRYGTATKCDYEPGGTPVLRIPNVANGVVDQADLKYGTLGDDERSTLSLRAGDILLIRSNGSVSLVGKPALVSKKENGFAFAGYLMRVRLNRAMALPGYICHALASPNLREQIEMPARSTSGVHNINTTEVKSLSIPLAPLAEQHEIVRRVEALFRLADAIEKRVAAATGRAEKLTQAILAKAFRGELVPTEAELARREGRTYEPASALLERIRTERAVEPPKKSSRRTKEP